MNYLKRTSLFVLFVVVTYSCSNSDDNRTMSSDDEVVIDDGYVEVDDPNADYHVLFIGNSLTSTNNLPRILKEYAAEMDINVSTKTVAGPGYGLQDHWNIGLIQSLINSNYYDYVVIQQGPSSQQAGRESLLDYGGRIADLCDPMDAELAFFMVWPSLTNYHTFDGVISSYSTAASVTNSILIGVGSYWKTYIEYTDDFSFYGIDGFHPSVQGSENAAELIFDALQLQSD